MNCLGCLCDGGMAGSERSSRIIVDVMAQISRGFQCNFVSSRVFVNNEKVNYSWN